MSDTATFPIYDVAVRKTTSAEIAPVGKTAFFFLWLFTIAIYARPEDFFPVVGQLHLTLTLGICAAVAYLGALFSGKAPFLWPRELKVVLWLTVWFAIGVPFAYWKGGSFQVLTQTWLKTALIFFLLTQTLLTLQRIRAILWAIVLSELAVTTYSILEPSQSLWAVDQRLSGINLGILGWNFLGIAVALTIPYIATLFICSRSMWKTATLAAATATMFWMLILTASRGGMLTVSFSIILTWFAVLRGTPRGRIVGAGLVIALVASVCVAPGVFWDRMQTLWSDTAPTNGVQASADASQTERTAVLKDAIKYTAEHPVFGLGLGNFEVARGTQMGANGWVGAHNTFTEISSEAGLPALVLFLILLATPIYTSGQIGRTEFAGPEADELTRMARATGASLTAFLLSACFAHIAYEYFLYYPIAIATGIEYMAKTMPKAMASNARRPVAQNLWVSASSQNT